METTSLLGRGQTKRYDAHWKRFSAKVDHRWVIVGLSMCILFMMAQMNQTPELNRFEVVSPAHEKIIEQPMSPRPPAELISLKHSLKKHGNPDQMKLDKSRRVEWNKTNIIGLILASVFCAIAAGGGIGGGGVLVPTYILVFGFLPKIAIPLSNITILGASIANMALNVSKRHSTCNRPLIDWNIILMMEPLTIIGAVIGTFINVISPPWLICILLVLLLTAVGVRTLKKGMKKYRQESAELAAIRDGRIEMENNQSSERMSERMQAAQMAQNQTYVDMLEQESQCPLNKIAFMCVISFGVLTSVILCGNGANINPLGITCGTFGYWCLQLFPIPFVIVMTYISRNWLVADFRLKKRINYEYKEGDVQWNERNTVVYPLICSIAGLCAGMFGIGGGIVKGPLMLEMGTLPTVTSATSATMILFTSSSATASYFIFGQLNLNFAWIVFINGFVFTLIGQLLVDVLVKKYKRASLIILIIGFIVAASAVAMGYQSSGSVGLLIEGHPEPGSGICDRS